MDFSNQVAIITGGAGGLGKDISLKLASNNIHVVVADISNDVEEAFNNIKNQFPDNKGFGIKINMSEEDDVQLLISETVKKFHRLDMMVNNAAIQQSMIPLVDTDARLFEKVFDVNVKGVFLGSKHAGKQMISQNRGTILNIASWFAKTAHAYFGCYCSSKAAVITLSQVLALELAENDITVNAVCPGHMETEMHFEHLRSEAKRTGRPFDELDKEILKQIPLGRRGTGVDIANLLLFLASENGNYITGQAINLAGGMERG